MKNFIITFCCALFLANIGAQTETQKKKIIANYDLVKSDAIIENFEKDNLERLIRINTFLSKLTEEELLDLDKVALRDITPDGVPLFYKSHNRNSAITIRADKLRSGGSLGLDLTGSNMIAGVWEAENGYPLSAHLDLTGRITVIDGGSGDSFHATHVAGTIMSSGVSTFFNTGRGIAYEASVYAANSANDISEMTVQAADGLLVSNHSYGYNAGSVSLSTFGAYTSDASSVDIIISAHPYYIPVISAGNDRDDFNIYNPTKNGYDLLTGMSNSKNGITSAAVESVPIYTSPFSVVMSSFSNYGPTDDGRIKPDISSQGVQVSSTSNVSISSYSNSSGTSMSAPAITGLLLLLQEHYNDVNSNFMLAATAKGVLLHTADEAGINQGPDYSFGWGLANGEKAAQTITNSSITNSFIEETSLDNSDSRSFNVIASGNEPLMVSISWTDPAAFPVFDELDSRVPKLINDLDIVLSKNGTDYYPWKLNPISPTIGATRNSTNDVDNFEKVEIDSPNADDVFEVTINHKGALAGGSQNYSLVITGGNLENLSTQNNTLSNSLKLFPNPNKGIFTISFNSGYNRGNEISIDVFDLSGRQVFSTIFENSSQIFRETLDLKNLQSGVYVANISQGNSSTSHKIIIE